MGFDSVFQYEVPYLHPLAVHFPLVLLMLAGGSSAIYLVWGKGVWRKATLIFLGLGAASAIFASRTGEALEDEVEGEPMVEELLEIHESVAKLTTISTLVAFVVVVAFSVWWVRRPKVSTLPMKEPILFRVALFLLAGFAAAVVAYTGHIGGLMVWGVPK